MASCPGLLQVSVFAIMALTASGVTTTAGQSCPAAFPDRLSAPNNDVYCFYISFRDNRKERFDAAQGFCRSIGGTLAEPRSSDVDIFLRNRMIQENLPGVNRYYIGADDRLVDGEWRWLSDNALVSSGYTRWASGVSSNPRNAECVVYASNLDYRWTNFQCMASNNFICQLGPIVERPEWVLGPWSPCSVTCGTGYRSRTYYCQFRNGTSGTCSGQKPSNESEACNNPPCIVERPEWVLGPWSPCSVTCGTGYRSRTYYCQFRNGTSGTCSGQKPSDESEACSNPPCIVERPEWVLGPWSPCSVTCGTGYRYRTYYCQFRNGTSGTCSGPKPSDEYEACNKPPCNGGTGPLCGRPHRHCLSTASCDESSNQCVCPGSMQGDATFQCIPQDCQRCTVELDPLVISWNRLASVHMNLPCKFRMARVVTPIIGGATQTYSKCRVEVLVANSLDLDKQILFAQEVTVVVDFVGNDADGNLVVSPVGPVSFYVNLWPINSQPGNPWRTNSTVRNGVLMLARFDSNNQIAILDIPQCKVQVGFRVFNLDEYIQTMKPGVSLAVSVDAIVDETAGFSACGQPGGDWDKFVQTATQLGLEGPKTAFLYQTLLDPLSANTNTGLWSDQCSALHSTVTNCGTDRRSQAFNLCNRIVNRRTYLKCLKGISADPLVVFNQCLTFACQGDTAACNSYMAALTQGRCPLTPRMRAVGCDPSRL